MNSTTQNEPKFFNKYDKQKGKYRFVLSSYSMSNIHFSRNNYAQEVCCLIKSLKTPFSLPISSLYDPCSKILESPITIICRAVRIVLSR